jgi:hypothetical protein
MTGGSFFDQRPDPDEPSAGQQIGCLIMTGVIILTGCGLAGAAWRVFRWAAGF